MKRKRLLYLILFLAFIIAWTLLIFIVGAQKIVDFIGVKDSYLVLFFIGAFGGVSLISATSYYATLATFSSTGLNPYLLGLFGGIGITLGDSLYYYFGRKGGETLTGKFKEKLRKFSEWLVKRKKLVPVISFVYFAFTPFPNEFITIPLGASGYSYKKLVIVLLVGNIILSTFTAKYLFSWLGI